MNTDQVLKYGALLLLLLVLLSIMGSPTGYNRPDKLITDVQLTSIIDPTVLKSMLKHRIKYIKRTATILDAVNSAIMSKVESLIDSATMDNMMILSLLVPGSGLGYIPIKPIKNASPQDTLLFQYEVGPDWYWLNMTFPGQGCGFLFQLTHVELLPRCLREKQYALGQTTLYQVSASVSINGKAYRNLPYTTGGTYAIINDTTFSFVDDGGLIKFSHSPGQMQLSFNLAMLTTDPNVQTSTLPPSGNVVVNCTINTNKPYYPQGPDGCAPCFGGVGTMYYCYSQLLGSGTISISTTTTPITVALNNGVGWMDHQWFGLAKDSVMSKLIVNAVSGGKSSGGFGRYMWIPLHISNDLQYLVTVIPMDTTITVKIGDSFDANWNSYQTSGITFTNKTSSNKAKVTIMNMTNFNGVDYPTVLKVDVNGSSYTVDGRAYGSSVIIDITGNDHWTQCADLLNDKGALIGTSFIEAMQFETQTNFTNAMWTAAGSKEMLGDWILKQRTMTSFVMSVLFLLVLGLLCLYLIARFGISLVKRD